MTSSRAGDEALLVNRLRDHPRQGLLLLSRFNGIVLQYPPGFSKAPHYHPGDAYITVLSGSYFRGYGNKVDRSSAVKLTPGTFSVNPAGVAHYEWSESEALIQVHAMGPWRSVYVDATGRPIESPRD